MKLYKYTGKLLKVRKADQREVLEEIDFENQVYGNEKLLLADMRTKSKSEYDCVKHRFLLKLKSKTQVKFELNYEKGIGKAR